MMHNGNGTAANSHNALARIHNVGDAPRQVPMEIDLNEFMLDTDLDFLSKHFNIGTYPY